MIANQLDCAIETHFFLQWSNAYVEDGCIIKFQSTIFLAMPLARNLRISMAAIAVQPYRTIMEFSAS